MKKPNLEITDPRIARLKTELARWNQQVRQWELQVGELQGELRDLGEAIERARTQASRVHNGPQDS